MHGKVHRLDNSTTTKPELPPVVGSKKRKNKQSITHLNTTENEAELVGSENALLGLATLAMVAARTEKIGENAEETGENLST